mmetsp:Transcript_24798/g.38589  ORF Transcript_24798/g.38589 Transcript_24798/m.38589 type:complete len:225 (+) Transcript_24798:218-892(+)
MIDIFEDDAHYCIVMDLMEGGELFDQILKRQHFSESEARSAIRSIIDAIRYCHSLNIVHRDIKPENLLIKSKELNLDSIKISDFGLARYVKSEEMARTTCGTPGYVAPEIILQKPYGKECDYWSIGVVLFILLSGSPPFYEDEDNDLFHKIKNVKYDFSDEAWNHISEEAKDLVTQILKQNPLERISCEQMLAHPWMSMELGNDNKVEFQNLQEYIKTRKDKVK